MSRMDRITARLAEAARQQTERDQEEKLARIKRISDNGFLKRAKAFLEELQALEEKHQIVLQHEDHQGCFLFTDAANPEGDQLTEIEMNANEYAIVAEAEPPELAATKCDGMVRHRWLVTALPCTLGAGHLGPCARFFSSEEGSK